MSVTRWVYSFDEPLDVAGDDLKSLLGGKGASLREMTRAGLRVPPGFTITTACCRRYFELGRRWPQGLEEQVREQMRRLEERTGRAFGRGSNPLLVSVRSGAAVSMPGMMDTLLNCGLHPGLADEVGNAPQFWESVLQFIRTFTKTVHAADAIVAPSPGTPGEGEGKRPERGATQKTARALLSSYEQQNGQPFPADAWSSLVACINAVFDSWTSERAVAYRRRNDVGEVHGTAVNVQTMWPSEVSGVVFTRDPNDACAEHMVIESSYGLGESVVSGDVTPDRFLVNRSDFSNVRSEIGHKAAVVRALGNTRHLAPDAPSLSPQQIADLARLALNVERHFSHPVDIEWGWADGEFALLQARSIRGLDVAREVETGRREEVERLRGMCNGRRRVWVAHNLGETLRFPTPLTWEVVRRFMCGDGGFGRLYRDLGYRPSRTVCEDGFLELICGRIYADPDRLAGLFWDGMPLAYDLDGLSTDPGALHRAPATFDADRADTRFLARLPANLWGMWRSARHMKRARRDAKRRFERDVLPPYLEYVVAKRGQDLSGLTDAQVVAELHERRAKVLDGFGPESLKPGFFGGLAFDSARSLLARLMGEQEGAALAGSLTRGLEGDTTFEQDALLYDVAHGRAEMAKFLERYGHRAAGEMELSQPRWREDAAYLEQMLARLRTGGRDPRRVHDDTVARRRAAEAELPKLLEQAGGGCLREHIERDLADARNLLPYRESGKHFLMMGYELIRLCTQELARRWDLGGRLYFLRLDELNDYAGNRGRLSDTIDQRRTRWQAMQRLDPQDVIDSADLDRLGLAPRLDSADDLAGTAVASGVASGAVRVVFDPRQAGDLGVDYVLVCPSTDPGWTPLFLNARALIVERGGVLSHGAIVARDFGIPAVVCPNATKLLRDGERVRVDGNTGKVSVLVTASQEAARA